MKSTLGPCLKAYCNKDHENWPALLPGIMMAFRMTPATESLEYLLLHLFFAKDMNITYNVAVWQKCKSTYN